MRRLPLSAVATIYPERGVDSLLLCGGLLVTMGLMFGSKGPLLVACLASILLILRSLGVRLATGDTRVSMGTVAESRLGSFALRHSHHDPQTDRKHHEFCIHGKYYCAGCYGLAFGTLVALALPATYFTDVLGEYSQTALLMVAPICFLPTVLRCFGWTSLRPIARSLSYGLLPIGSWIILIGVDGWLDSALANSVALSVVVFAWYAGGAYHAARTDLESLN